MVRKELSAAMLALLAGANAFLPPPAMTTMASRPRSGVLSMSVAIGDKLPLTTTFQELVEGKPTDVSALELFAGKKVVVVGVPGAHTPTCSEKHVPGFLEKADDFFGKGVDSIVVLSVNDCFVMHSWAKALGADSKVKFLADGGAAFTKAAGLEFDTGNFGGPRLQRLSALVEDGVVKKIHLEGGGGLTSSTAEVLLGEI